MPKDDQNEESTSILAKVGNPASGVGSFLGRGAKVLAKGAVFPIWPKNWFKSWGRMRHGIKNGGRSIIGTPLEEYDPPIKTTQASEDLGIQITKQGEGKVSFLVSRTLTGDIPYLSPEQLNQIEACLPNITIFREGNKIKVEVKVGIKKIIEDIKTDSKNKGKSPEEIKKLALQGIADSINGELKELAGITGGEFKVHKDLKLLYGAAKELYRKYDNQNKPSKTGKSPGQSSENVTSTDELVKSFNITNPNEFPFGKSKEAISPIKNMQLSEQDIKKQVEGLGSTFLNFEGASGKVIKPLSTPDVERNKGRGI